MQNKGAILTFAILLAAVCMYQLAFTFKAKQIEKDYNDKDFIMVGLLKGSVAFMVDLMRKVNLDLNNEVELVHNGKQSSKYAIEYLEKFAATKVSKKVKIQFTQDMPIKLSFQNGNNELKITFILAPRVEVD